MSDSSYVVFSHLLYPVGVVQYVTVLIKHPGSLRLLYGDLFECIYELHLRYGEAAHHECKGEIAAHGVAGDAIMTHQA